MFGRLGVRSRYVALGALVAVLSGGGLLTASAAGSPLASSFVPITPCRLFDTRAGSDNIGPRATPLGPNETFIAAVWGTNGNCTIPSGASGVSISVAIINPTSGSFLTVFPADATRPLTSNLNWVAGQAPTPNGVTAALSTDGRLALYNLAGTVDLLVDIVGYYELPGTHTHDDRYYTESEVDAALSGKADASNVYTKGEINNALAGKANSSDVYTTSQVDGALSGKANAPLVQAGTSANDQFLNFLGAPLALDNHCGDADGCRITLIRVLGGTRFLYGPITFQIAGNQWWTFAGGAAGSAAAGTSSNGLTQNILGNSSLTTECFLSDWDTSGTDADGDQNGNFSVIVYNETGTPQTCTIKVED